MGKCGMRNWDAGMSASGIAVPARRVASVCAWLCGSVVAVCIGLRLASHFCCGGLPSVHARIFGFVGMIALGLHLALRFCCHGLRLALRFYCGGLPSEYARRCGSVVAFAFDARPSLQFYWAGGIGLRLALRSVVAVCIGLRLALRFCCGVLPSVHARIFGFVGMIALGLHLALRFYCGVLPRFTPAVCRMATNRTACDILRSYSAGRDRHLCVLEMFFGYLPLWVHFGFECFFVAISTGLPENEKTKLRDWRRGLCAFLRSHIGFEILSAGSTLGLRAPDCAKESSTLWTLFTLRRGCVGAYSPRHHPGTRKDPPGSDLWPGRSGCIVLSFLALRGSRWNRHCRRAAPKRRGVGLTRAKRCGALPSRSGVEAALPSRSGVEAGTAGTAG